jgi:hypothetical protein
MILHLLHILQWHTGKEILFSGDHRQTVGLRGQTLPPDLSAPMSR